MATSTGSVHSSSDRGQRPIRLLLDTSCCLALIQGASSTPSTLFDGYLPGEVAISSITVAALQTRVQRSVNPTCNQQALEQFLMPLVVVDFDAAAAQQLGQIAAWWQDASDPNATHAQLLAAQAICFNTTLATAHAELYAPVPGLRIDASLTAQPQFKHAPAPSAAPSTRPTPGTIIAIGSHDMTLDLLADSLHAEHPEVTLVSAHVGSLDGLLALRRGEAHLAGTHLLDGETGRYNTDHIERLLTAHGMDMVLVGFVNRIQGLIVPAGNPKAITTLADLLRENVTFVNRQPGAGTRVLLDYALKRQSATGAQVQGYDNEESSHLAVATLVANGQVDCGLGIQAAAQAHGLGFVPLFDERYDLAIPRRHYESPLLAPLLDLLQRPTSDFLNRVAALGGYDAENMGKLMAELYAEPDQSRGDSQAGGHH
jgi:molybdate-binding protein/predicted nucleic acid-binding protein